jgi:hypothetical protein
MGRLSIREQAKRDMRKFSADVLSPCLKAYAVARLLGQPIQQPQELKEWHDGQRQAKAEAAP